MELVLALLPALLMAGAGIFLNHFALIDDGVQIFTAKGRIGAIFVTDGGRFFPLYWLYTWIMVRLLPIQPWAFSMVNGAFLLIAVGQIWALTRRWRGPLAGILAAWLFALNLATVENLFTLGKSEPKQLVFWLLALNVLATAVYDEQEPAHPRRDAVTLSLAVFASLMIKETGILFAAPLGLFVLLTALSWKRLTPALRRHRLGLLLAAILPLAFSLFMTLRIGLRHDSYTRQQVFAKAFTTYALVPVFDNDRVLALMILTGLVAGLLLLLARATVHRRFAALLFVQFCALAGFFTLIQANTIYYYYPAAALSSVFIGAALFPPAPSKRRLWTGAIVASTALVFCISLTLAGASALTSWSWLYGRLTSAVERGKPSRALFYQAGSQEVHQEAKVTWNLLRRIPVKVGVLATPGYAEPDIQVVQPRDLQPGDWIMEEFGTPDNSRIPFRDMTVNLTPNYGLVYPDGQTLLPIRLVEQNTARFRLPVTRWVPFSGPKGYLQWRIFAVTEAPRFLVEGIDADRWMEKSATVWLKAGAPAATLRFQPYVPPQGLSGSHLLILAGAQQVADCPVSATGITQCRIDPAKVGAEHVKDGWIHLDLRASQTFCPKTLGISADTRNFSYNFAPTWAAGLAGLFAEPAGKIGSIPQSAAKPGR